MQDEVSKHARKIYHHMKSNQHSFKEKVKDILVEIIIIVFAVTLSIWFHNWSLYRHQQKEVKVFLQNLREDLKKDTASLNRGRIQYQNITSEYEKLDRLKPEQFDSLEKVDGKYIFHVNLQGKQINDGNFESFKSSGKIAFIENEKLKQLLLGYYQRNLPGITTIDNFYSQFLFKVLDLKIENAGKADREIYANAKFKEAVHYLILIGKNNITNYETMGLKPAREILEEINRELQ